MKNKLPLMLFLAFIISDVYAFNEPDLHGPSIGSPIPEARKAMNSASLIPPNVQPAMSYALLEDDSTSLSAGSKNVEIGRTTQICSAGFIAKVSTSIINTGKSESYSLTCRINEIQASGAYVNMRNDGKLGYIVYIGNAGVYRSADCGDLALRVHWKVTCYHSENATAIV